MAGGVGPVDALGLVEPVGRLGQGVVVAVGDGADAGAGADLVEPFGEAHTGELRAGIGVGHEPDQAPPAPGPSCHLERVEDHVGAHVRRHPPADDAAAEGVDDEAHIGHARSGRHVGEVGDPQGVGPLGGEVAVHQVRCPDCVRVRDGGEDPLAAPADALDAQLPHQPGGLVPADLMTGTAGGLPELVGPVDLPVRDPQHHEDLHHHRVPQRPSRRLDLAGLGRVVRARSHLQRPADGLDSELVTVTVDVVDDQRCGRSSSAAKKADADFRIGKDTPMLRVVTDDDARAEMRSSLDEIVLEGARRMLAAALEAEVDAYVASLAGERDERGHRLVVRNGHAEPRTITTAAGRIEVRAPRVDDRRVDEATGERCRFRSAILPPWARRSPKVTEVLPLMYLHGMSTGDFAPALAEFFGSAAGLSASVITRLTTQWQDEQRAFAKRRLDDRDYVYIWADGVHFNVRLEEDRLCCLVIVGVRADGTKELVALADGYRESTESWADLLRDLKRRGMRAPVLAVGDGALGFWGALREVFPETRGQRCWVHKVANVLSALPKSAQPTAKRMLAEIRDAEDRDHAVAAADRFAGEYGAKWPKAVAKVVDDLEPLLPARTLSVHVTREVEANGGRDGYSAWAAHQRARGQARRPKVCKLQRGPLLVEVAAQAQAAVVADEIAGA
jgi:putative transposase